MKSIFVFLRIFDLIEVDLYASSYIKSIFVFLRIFDLKPSKKFGFIRSRPIHFDYIDSMSIYFNLIV